MLALTSFSTNVLRLMKIQWLLVADSSSLPPVSTKLISYLTSPQIPDTNRTFSGNRDREVKVEETRPIGRSVQKRPTGNQ